MIFEKSFTTKIVCEVEEYEKVTAVKMGKESFFLSSKEYLLTISKHPKWNIFRSGSVRLSKPKWS